MSEKLAKLFHETYERLAPEFNYKTRKASAVPWEMVPENNKKLMIAVCSEVERELQSQLEAERKRAGELYDLCNEACDVITTLHGDQAFYVDVKTRDFIRRYPDLFPDIKNIRDE